MIKNKKDYEEYYRQHFGQTGIENKNGIKEFLAEDLNSIKL